MSDSPAANSVEEFPENKQVRNNIFISYSHRDAESDNDWYGEVETYLGRLGNLVKDDLDVWSDKKIKINDKWHDEIDHKLKTAQAAILLISP
jgi:hypothetical protein